MNDRNGPIYRPVLFNGEGVVYSKMGVPMQALGAWMWSMAQTVAAMSVMWVRREVSPGVMCHPIKMSGIWESL